MSPPDSLVLIAILACIFGYLAGRLDGWRDKSRPPREEPDDGA